MSDQENQLAKYNIEINQPQGLVVGNNTHVEQHFHAAPSSLQPVTRDELLAAIHAANAELREVPYNIADVHIDRPEVDQIVEWIRQTDTKERLGIVLDQPGSGKTVVMHDVLLRLENEGVPVLAIKADFLSGIRTRSDLAERLGLPDTVEDCARQIAAEGMFVVLLDQLDALSLSLSRDQSTLDVMLGTLARLRNIDNVCIVASCRIFDLNNDPKLSQIKVNRQFSLQPLADEEINRVLQAIGIRLDHLLPAHRTLLATPLHLEVYARVVAAATDRRLPESFYSLQELYHALWRRRIEVVPPDAPRPAERIAAIYQLVDVMQNNRQIVAPIAVLDDYPEAATYLERVGFIRREGNNWLFFHQTLFDYCYARRFVAQEKSLSQEILNGLQGLFERSQMVQVLAYLRGANETLYPRELTTLLFSDTLRIHLHLLLIGWFGSLPNPTAVELQIARRFIMNNDENRARFFRAVSGNVSWFDQLREEIIPAMLRAPEEREVDPAAGFLTTLVDQRPEDVLAHLRPYLGVSEAWDERIAFCLTNLKSWRSETAVEMLCDLFRRRRTFNRESSYLYNMRANPAAGCRVLQIYLDLRLDNIIAQLQTAEDGESHLAEGADLRDRFAWKRYLLGEHTVGELIREAVQACPDKVLEYLLPWFIRASTALGNPPHSEEDYSYDFVFASHWYGDHLSEGAAFARQIAFALQRLARESPATFRELANALSQIESQAIQRVLAEAYLSNPNEYYGDIFAYLIADPRRLNVGEPLESPHHDSMRLYAATFPHLEDEQRRTLESMILQFQPAWELRGLGRRGITQLHFLQAVPVELLSEPVRRRRQELEHRFPGFKLQPPRGVTGGVVGPPIEQEAQAKMSDKAWLGAMRKYDDDTGWDGPREHFFKGGVIELSRSFTEQVKQDPKRFYQLAQRFDESISLHYITAAITGLAESDAPSDWVFDLVRRFAYRLERESRRSVCWALSKRAEEGVPDDLLDLMTEWALDDPDPEQEMWRVLASSGQPYYGGDPHDYGINTNRGAAVRVACHCALERTPPQYERVFILLEQVSENDPSTAVRTCVIDVLGPLLNQDVNRTLNIFEQTLEDHPALLQSPLTHQFLYWVYREHFDRVRLYIETLLTHSDDSTRQAGARLACLAAFHYPKAIALAEQALNGDESMRRGAAQVYSRNLEYENLGEASREYLLVLMHDPDKEVQRYVGECFSYLRVEHLGGLRSFIEVFLASPSLLSGAEHLIEYLNPLAADEHQLALEVTSHLLDVAGSDIVDFRTSMAVFERDIVHMPLTVYTHALDPETKSRAMELFEQLLLLGSRSAHQALADWDRR